MITNEKLENIISDSKKAGYDVRVRDISYVLLCRFITDRIVVYKSIFGASTNDAEIDLYDQSKQINFLKNYLKDIAPLGGANRKKKDSDISFDENKEEMIKLIKETQDAMDRGEIEAKDGLKIQADLRVKINDKFGVKEESNEQLVLVNCKYNEICSCGREIYIPTKEDLMKKYNLVENDKK